MAQKGAQPITSVEHIPGSERGKGEEEEHRLEPVPP